MSLEKLLSHTFLWLNLPKLIYCCCSWIKQSRVMVKNFITLWGWCACQGYSIQSLSCGCVITPANSLGNFVVLWMVWSPNDVDSKDKDLKLKTMNNSQTTAPLKLTNNSFHSPKIYSLPDSPGVSWICIKSPGRLGVLNPPNQKNMVVGTFTHNNLSAQKP